MMGTRRLSTRKSGSCSRRFAMSSRLGKAGAAGAATAAAGAADGGGSNSKLDCVILEAYPMALIGSGWNRRCGATAQ